MVLKCVLCSALAVVVAAHSSLCSGPCPVHSQEALTLVQRHASTLAWSRDVDATNEAAEGQQKPEMDLAMKDLDIDEKHKAELLILFIHHIFYILICYIYFYLYINIIFSIFSFFKVV